MTGSFNPPASTARRSAPPFGLWFSLSVSALYCAWIGAHWIPLDYSDQELSAIVSRVWDIKRGLMGDGHIPWWTPYYMGGYSYALHHAQGFYLIPWLLLSTVFDLQVAGKLTALAAIFASTITMYACARYFLRNDWAAALAALAYTLHPQLLVRSGGTEHIGVVMLAFPVIPLLWLCFARAFDSPGFKRIFTCAVIMVVLNWVSFKMIVVQGLFLLLYAAYRLWEARRSSA